MRTWGFLAIHKQKSRAAPKSQPRQKEMWSAAWVPPGTSGALCLGAVGHQAAVAEKPLGYVNTQLCLQAY